MENHTWWFFTVAVGLIVSLIGIVYRSLVYKIDELKIASKEGLAAKVDGTEYVVRNKWQEAEYGDLKLIIRELRASNDSSHQAIMIEIKRTNDTLKILRS